MDLDIFNNRYYSQWCSFEKGAIPKEFERYCNNVSIRFYTRDIQTDEKGYHLEPNVVDLCWDDDWAYMDTDTEEEKARQQAVKSFMDSFEIGEIVLEKAKMSYGSSAFAYKYLV